MKIAICASVSHEKEIKEVQRELEQLGHAVEVPQNLGSTDYENVTAKVHGDLIRGYYHVIQSSDAVLVLNLDKNGVAGYVGGNTLMELGFGYVLGKRCYIYNEIPEMSYTDELKAMNPIVLNGDLKAVN